MVGDFVHREWVASLCSVPCVFGHLYLYRPQFPLLDTPCSEVISEAVLLCRQEESNEKEAEYGDTRLKMVTLAWVW